MSLLADYAITPDVFDVTSYTTVGECEARLATIHEAMLTEGLVRDVRDGAWSDLFGSDRRLWHRRGQVLLKKMATQGRFLRFEPALPNPPAHDRAWCAEALATDDRRPFRGGVITTGSVKEAYAKDRRVARMDRLSSAPWWASRSSSVRVKRTSADYEKHLELVLRFSNSSCSSIRIWIPGSHDTIPSERSCSEQGTGCPRRGSRFTASATRDQVTHDGGR